MKVSELLVEERNKDWKYTEKRVKGALNKVILELEGSDSGAMSRLMTRYKRLDRQWKLMEERRNEVNRQVKDVADRIFDAEDALATRVIETVSYSVMLTKATPASEKEATKKVDYESAYAALARLVPELEAKAKEILEKYTELVPPKDTPAALKYTPKLDEGVGTVVKGWLSKAKAFVKEFLGWGRSYDAKLDAFRRKYKLKAAIVKEDIEAPKAEKFIAPSKLRASDLKSWLGDEITRTSEDEDLPVQLVTKIPEISHPSQEANEVFRALSWMVKPGAAKAYRMSNRNWMIVVSPKDVE